VITDIKEAAQILNSLKMGVIPNIDIGFFCVGRDKHKFEIERCLNLTAQGSGIVKFIAGEYGSGKSLMLGLVKQLALQNNFIVSSLQIDNSIKFNDLGSLYYHMMHNLSIKSIDKSETSFQDIFDRWIEYLQSLNDKERAATEINIVIKSLNDFNSSFARAFLVYIKSRINNDIELSNCVASWIKGEQNIPAALKAKFEIKGSINKENSMDFFKAFVKLIKLLGYKGLVILVDEIELLMNVRADIRKNCYENLRYLIDSCGNEDLSGCMFCFAGTLDFFENTEKGIKTYPALDQRLGNAIDKKNSSLSDIRQTIMRLSNLNGDEFQLLTDEIIKLHKQAYNWQPQISNGAIKSWTLLALRNEKSEILKINIRKFIVKLIEVLDIMEQHPGYNIFNNELKLVNNSNLHFVQTSHQ